jgi:hypothetical protein
MDAFSRTHGEAMEAACRFAADNLSAQTSVTMRTAADLQRDGR